MTALIHKISKCLRAVSKLFRPFREGIEFDLNDENASDMFLSSSRDPGVSSYLIT